MQRFLSLRGRELWLRFRGDAILMALVVAWGVVRLWPELDHESIWGFDESFHQVVTRHAFEHPLSPSLFDDPVHPETNDHYWGARAWLIKPPGAFWTGALMMHLVGKVPLAFRLGGFLSQLFAALVVYLAARRLAGRLWATLASAGFLALPSGWILTQTQFVGDELDLQLCGWMTLSMLGLYFTVKKRSVGWAALSGAAMGAAFLVKFVLALTPIGVAGCLWGLSRARWCEGPRRRDLLVMAMTSLAVALPWHLYARARWPEYYLVGSNDALVHLLSDRAAQVAPQWRRPPDAVINEIVRSLFGPTPHVLFLLASVWLVVRAIRTRDVVAVGASLWLWATWLVHSVAAIKIYSHLWNATVPAFIALAVVMKDVWSSRRLSWAVVAACATSLLVESFPVLERLRAWAPASSQTATVSGWVEGTVLMVAAIGLSLLVERIRVLKTASHLGMSLVAVGWMNGWTVYAGARRQAEYLAASAKTYDSVYTRDVGQALDAATPAKSLVMLDTDSDGPQAIERHNLMFWSNRLVHQGRNLEDYPQAGFHPYVVSPMAQRYRAVPVPGHAWLRAFDLAAPQEGPQPLPSDVHQLDIVSGSMRVLGVAHERSNARTDHYALYVRAEGEVRGLRLAFRMRDGSVRAQSVEPERSLVNRRRLRGSDWFVLPVVGPHAEDVSAIAFGDELNQVVDMERLPSK